MSAKVVRVLCYQAGFDAAEVAAYLRDGYEVILTETKPVFDGPDKAKAARIRSYLRRHPDVKVES